MRRVLFFALLLVIMHSAYTEDIQEPYSDGLDVLLEPFATQHVPLGDILGSVFSKIPE